MNGLAGALRFGAWGCVLAIAILSLLPAEEMVRTSLGGHIEHAVAYAGTASIMALAYAKRRLSSVAAALIVYAGVLEFLQRFSPGRHSSVDDFLASSVGVLIGIAAVISVRAVRRVRV